MYENRESAFVSLNERDAQQKIDFAYQLYLGIPPQFRQFVPVINQSKEELIIGHDVNKSKLQSRPASNALRGVSANIYLDETDLYKPGQDKEVYTAAIGRVTRKGQRLTLGSSVFGEATLLSSLMADDNNDFVKARLPWWVTDNQDILESIDIQRRNMDELSFQQEYECHRGDVAGATFSQELIRKSWNDNDSISAGLLNSADTLVLGYDVGGGVNPAAMTILRQSGTRWEMTTLESFMGDTLAAQEDMLNTILDEHPNAVCALDATGLGRGIAQNLEKRWGKRRFKAVYFNPRNKNEMVSNLKRNLEDGLVTIIRDSQLTRELNRTQLTPTGVVEQKGNSRRTHFDLFWALALANSLTMQVSGAYWNLQKRYVDLYPEDEDEVR
jgi:hypothetical protein